MFLILSGLNNSVTEERRKYWIAFRDWLNFKFCLMALWLFFFRHPTRLHFTYNTLKLSSSFPIHFSSPLKEIQPKNVSDAIKFIWQQQQSWNKACVRSASRIQSQVMTKRTKTLRSLIAIRNLPTNYWGNLPVKQQCQEQKKNLQTLHPTTYIKSTSNKFKSSQLYIHFSHVLSLPTKRLNFSKLLIWNIFARKQWQCLH